MSAIPFPNNRRYIILFFVALVAFIVVSAIQFWPLATTNTIIPPQQTIAQQNIETLQAKLQRQPDNPLLLADLGLAYLQRVRETGDSTYYTLAAQALDEALRQEPEQLNALIGQGTLALARHDFTAALEWGQQAAALNPYGAEPLAIMVDAYVELGRYDEAVATLQILVNTKPGIAAYSRVSYLRELHGDIDGAIAAMRQAAETGSPGQEATAWAQTQLANLYLGQGKLADAEKIYTETLYYNPDYPFAQAGLGRLAAANGDYTQAIALLLPLTERYPLPEFIIALGDYYTLNGQPEQAARQYELVYLMQALNEGAGMDMELEIALFEADHSGESQRTPAEVVTLAQAAYERRPSVEAADVLAWALYKNGEYETAWDYSQEALRLGTRSARYHYHTAVIADALGNTAAAQTHLTAALEIDPHLSFSPLYAPQAHALSNSLN